MQLFLPSLLKQFTLLKVKQSRKYVFKPTFLPKNKQTNSTLLLWYLSLTFFLFVFWKKLKTPKRHFEINWPLRIHTTQIFQWPTNRDLDLKSYSLIGQLSWNECAFKIWKDDSYLSKAMLCLYLISLTEKSPVLGIVILIRF